MQTTSRTYEVELDNAFGLVNGSEVRIAGVKGGTVKELDINEAKRALITVEVGQEFGEFKEDANCSAEPQSLIAEYFLDCQPGVSPTPLEGPVPVEQTTTTVPNDLVNNTLREPFKRGLQLLINEFGTALTGNAENLNAAILRGAPALRELKQVTDVLANQNTTIAELNANSDQIISRLTERREDVVRFIDEAEDTARISATRRAALSEQFKLLPEFLAELRPTMEQLGNVASEQEPLLTDLHRSAKKLTTFSRLLPPFNDATSVSLDGLGDAAEVGERALTRGRDEINQLRVSTQNAYPAADILTQFLDSLGSPRNAVEEDERARFDLRDIPGEADRRVALLNNKTGGGVTEPGYSGLEGLLNYVYYQTGALNQFDQIGHLLHFILMEVETSPCAGFNPGPTYPGGGTDPKTAPDCVAILGDNQPGVTPAQGVGNEEPTTGLSRYDNSVCPMGSTEPLICDPNISLDGGSPRRVGGTGGAEAPPAPPAEDAVPPEVLKDIQEGKPLDKPLEDILGIPTEQQSLLGGVDQVLQQLGLAPQSNSGAAGSSGGTASNLLNFLFGP